MIDFISVCVQVIFGPLQVGLMLHFNTKQMLTLANLACEYITKLRETQNPLSALTLEMTVRKKIQSSPAQETWTPPPVTQKPLLCLTLWLNSIHCVTLLPF